MARDGVPPTFTIRPAAEADIKGINAIHAHYIQHTVANFALQPRTDSEALDKFRQQHGLPWLVAVDHTTSHVIGFCLVFPFRGALAGYRHTVELSLFCHPKELSRGVGSALLEELLKILRYPSSHGEADDWISSYWREENNRIQSVIVCMALDETGKEDGWALKEWYEARGFEMCGRLKKVGRKFDRWIDTVYLQLTL